MSNNPPGLFPLIVELWPQRKLNGLKAFPTYNLLQATRFSIKPFARLNVFALPANWFMVLCPRYPLLLFWQTFWRHCSFGICRYRDWVNKIACPPRRRDFWARANGCGAVTQIVLNPCLGSSLHSKVCIWRPLSEVPFGLSVRFAREASGGRSSRCFMEGVKL